MQFALELVVAAALSALLGALLAYLVLTRRLRDLAIAVNRFRDGDLEQPLQLAGKNPTGDDIDRLGAALQEMSERIVREMQQLQRAQANRLELLANVSHDLRTPLASMQGYLEILLLKQGAMSPEEQQSYLEIATRHCERLTKLIRDLFQLSKLEARKLALQCEPFSAAELVQDLVQKFQLNAERRGLRLSSVLAGQPTQVNGDIAMIETALENLIDNAMRNTPRGGEIRVEVEPRAGRVALRVADTGFGIAREDLAKIFERYYHRDRTAAGASGGTGLGLAIVRRIVELHGSAVSVESTLGQGTVFGFDLAGVENLAPTPSALAQTSVAPG
jgi:signal transduction histidine kinase